MDEQRSPEAPTLEMLEEEERRLVLPNAELPALYALGRRMADVALERGLPILIQIRAGGRLVFVASMPGSTASNDEWAERKARMAVWFEASSLRVGRSHAERGEDVHVRHRLAPERFAAHGGAFPLRVRGAGVVGTVVVSGLPQLEDHAFVVEMLEAHLAGQV